MRILQIRFSNLNSLVGEWQVDLTDPAYVADGIFAITGPTGAGKTTLLDAICLALYGRTPRLNKLTQSANDIMSRQCGECFAEVVFETGAGRYRCHWSQHRARKKAGAALQSPKHEIARADTGEILEASLRATGEQIERLTGMDFDRFTRSMLLAQGGFAAFLQASADERAPILEQITGTEIYSQISISTHEVLREAREKLALLKSETQGIVVLDAEQEAGLQQGLQGDLAQEQLASAAQAQTGAALDWLKRIDALKTEVTRLEHDEVVLGADRLAFEPVRQQIGQAQAAAVLEGRYATVCALRKQQADDQGRLADAQGRLPSLESIAAVLREQLTRAGQTALDARAAFKAAAPVWRQVRELDQHLAANARDSAALQQQVSEAATRLAALDQQLNQTRVIQAKAQQQLAAATTWLQNNRADEWLVTGLAGLEEQVQGLLARERESRQKAQEHAQAQASIDAANNAEHKTRHQLTTVQDELEMLAGQRRQVQDDLASLLQGRLPREYHAEKEGVLREMALVARIAALETERTRLEAGKPCPLCGSIDHPFAHGQVPVPDALEQRVVALNDLMARAEALETRGAALQSQQAALGERLAGLQAAQATAAAQLQSAEATQARLSTELGMVQLDICQRRDTVVAALAPLGAETLPQVDLDLFLQALRNRRERWLATGREKAGFENALITAERDLQHQTQAYSVQLEQRERLATQLAQLQSGQARLLTQRQALFADGNPDDEEHQLQQVLDEADVAERHVREKLADATHNATRIQAQCQALRARLADNATTLADVESGFAQVCGPAGFVDEAAFLAARLPQPDLEALLDQAKALDERTTQLATRLKDHRERLLAEQALQLTDATVASLEAQQQVEQARLAELAQAIAAARHRLADNARAKERIRDKQAAIEAQQAECRRWGNLHELIGSSDGKKYRNFAQGLTFEMMVRHANRQLQKMTDRYLLVRDSSQPLELNVVDTWQAGEIRSTRNLSGGESFIVSLSLALGLSGMASHNVRVDSLFLDEGFGTLDEEALDTALETLAGLYQEGKLIGIISHVPALKERIATQIQVVPRAGGNSDLQGPGCQRVA